MTSPTAPSDPAPQPATPSPTPAPAPPPRICAFVDFWNFQIGINDRVHRGYPIDWKNLGPWLAAEAAQIISAASHRYENLRVYLSTGNGPKDPGLRNWALNTLDRFPGVIVTLKQRKPKGPPKCGACNQAIPTCPHCAASLSGTVEKGIDTSIVTDMIQLAWSGSYDVAVLLSSDADFVPAVEFLETRGIRTINAHFPPDGMELARKCWGSIDLIRHQPPRR